MREQVTHVASARLREAIRSFVGYRYDGLTPGTHLGLPSTTLTFVLPIDDRLDVSFTNGRRTYDLVVGGLHTTPATIHFGVRQHGVQIGIDPLACRALLGVPAAELAQTIVELDDLWGARAHRLLEAAHSTSDVARQCARVERMIDPVESFGVRPEVSEAWRLVLRSGGLIGVQQMADAVGWSRRHLEQEFRREFGISPKQACRLRRFERAVDLVREGESLAESAAEAGFSDQPHLTRDWKELTGTTPMRWRREDQLAFVQDSANALRHGESHDY